MVRFVGLDVHKRVVEACVLDKAGNVVLRHRFNLDREKLVEFAKKHLQPEDRVVLEATFNTWAIVAILRPFVAEVVVSNPMQTKVIAQAKVKTDKVDARVLAQLLRCDFLPVVWQPDEATQEARRLTRRRASLVADRTAVKNRIHAVLAQRLMLAPVGELFGPAGLAWLRSLELDGPGRLMIESDSRLLEGIEAEITSLEVILAQKGHGDERVKLLMTLPGIDITVALGLVAALGDISRFRDGDHLAGYLGLAPSTHQSADHCYHGPITKAGNSLVRCLLVQAAQHVRLHPGPLGAFFRKLAKKKNYNIAVTATARKLAVITWHLLTKKEPYRYAQPDATQKKYQRLRIKATGECRPRGAKPGERRSARLGAGTRSRTVKSLSQVYQEEGLPALQPMPAGEGKVLLATKTESYVESLQKAHVVPVKPRKREEASAAARG